MRSALYYLTLYYPNDPVAKQRREVEWAADVLKVIREMFAQEERCDHIVVSLDGTRMFAVDRRENTISTDDHP